MSKSYKLAHLSSPLPRRAQDLAVGRVRSFAEIAKLERKVERHVCLLAPFAFLRPGILAEIVEGTSPEDAAVTALAPTVPFAWPAAPTCGAQSC
jgi:hypothetical protein